MTTGWPQNQQDLRWPYSDANEAGPDSRAGGRVATDSDRSGRSATFSGLGAEHPSGPLPVTPSPQSRGRLGRGKSRGSRETLGLEDGAGDADYDWIRYLGEAGPAQEPSKHRADSSSSINEDSRSGRGAGRSRSRRHAAPDQPEADTDARPSAVRGTSGHRGRPSQIDDYAAPGQAAPDRFAPDRSAPDRSAPGRAALDRTAPERLAPGRQPARPAEPAPESWTSGLAGPATSRPAALPPGPSRPAPSRHGFPPPGAAADT